MDPTWEHDGTHLVERHREGSGFSSHLFPGAICLITRCIPAFDRSAWLHYLRLWKAAALSCISLKQGVISDDTRKTRSSPARGKALTRCRCVMYFDSPNCDALSAA